MNGIILIWKVGKRSGKGGGWNTKIQLVETQAFTFNILSEAGTERNMCCEEKGHSILVSSQTFISFA